MRLALLFYLYRNLLKEMIGFYKNFRNFQFKLAIQGLRKEHKRGERN
jgi:hypothetical protein